MKIKTIITASLSFFLFILFSSCASIPHKAQPVKDFDANRYLGAWYEIARFDYRFEKNMNNVIAQYSLKENGDIKVFNSGYNYKKKEWKSSVGSAKFRTSNNIGALKVTFFKPFYSGYNIIAVDSEYQYALVAGRNLKYLWLLSRHKTMPESVKLKYLEIAEGIGYDTSGLIWVAHDHDSPFLDEK